METNTLSTLTDSHSSSHNGQQRRGRALLATGDRVRITSVKSPWNGKIGRIVKVTAERAETILESANPHLKSKHFSLAALECMSHHTDPDVNEVIADELDAQFAWSQDKVRPEHVLVDFVKVFYDQQFLHNVVQWPARMELYKSPALARQNKLIFAAPSEVWVLHDVWVPIARVLTAEPTNHREQQDRPQETDSETEAIHVPSEVCVESASVGATTFYSAHTSELPATTRNNQSRRAVTPPADQHHSDGTVPMDVLRAMQVVARWMTEENIPVDGDALERLFKRITE
jgi:hypothetical protein